MGQAEHGRFTGDFIYYCKVRCLCLTPHANQIMEGQVFKANKMGAYVLVISDGRVQDAMRILVPRDLHMGQAEFDELSAGMTIRVRVLRSRFQAGDEFIQAVGTYEGQVAGPVSGPVSGAEEVGAGPVSVSEATGANATGSKESKESKEFKAVEATA
jgi:DNA-directed RNA polymerase subunit E'/Rpb7